MSLITYRMDRPTPPSTLSLLRRHRLPATMAAIVSPRHRTTHITTTTMAAMAEEMDFSMQIRDIS